MLIEKVELNHQRKLRTLDPLGAYDPELETCQKRFARRYAHHSASLDALDEAENVSSKFALSDPGNSIVFRLIPGVRCSP